MDQLPRKPRGPMTLLLTSRVVRRFAALVVALPAMYVLSFGPVFRAVDLENAHWVVAFYRPLIRIANSTGVPWTGEFILWYGGDNARFMALIELITDSVSASNDWGSWDGMVEPDDVQSNDE